jgi:hypothetical protein
MITLTLDKHALVKGELFHIRFGLTGTRTVHTTSNIQTYGLCTHPPPPQKGATVHHCATGQGIACQAALSTPLMAAEQRTV